MNLQLDLDKLNTLLAGSGIDSIVSIELLTGGNISTVYRLATKRRQTLILKLIDDAEHLEAEALCLEAWRQVGVKTPLVYDQGTFLEDDSKKPFLLLESIEGENLLNLLEADRLPVPNILQDIGLILARMHQVKGQGFGRITIQGDRFQGEFESFKEERLAAAFQDEIAINLRTGRISRHELQLIGTAIDIVNEHARLVGPSLAHTDFRAGNIIYNPVHPQPYTVIDPNPQLTHPYMCLAYALILEIIHARRKPDPLLTGYARLNPVETDILTAAIFLTTVSQLSRWGDRKHPYANNLKKLLAQIRVKL